MYRSRKDAQTFCKNVKCLREVFKPGASSCRVERGNLVRDAQAVQRLWRHHFSTLLRGEGDINAATSEDSEPAPKDDDGVDIPPSSHNEVRVAKKKKKNNKAAGTDAELFKAGGDKFPRSMHQLICRIWLE